MKKIAPSERMEQDLMRGLVTDADPFGEGLVMGVFVLTIGQPADCHDGQFAQPWIQLRAVA